MQCRNLRRKGVISEKELKHSFFEYKKATSLRKLYLLPKINKRLKNAPGRPVFLTAEHRLKMYQSFLTTTLAQSCKMVYLWMNLKPSFYNPNH